MTRAVLLLACLVLAACGAAPVAEPPARRSAATLRLPEMKTFDVARPAATTRSNAAIARDFLDLAFRMESGRTLPRLTRFREPIRVAVAGPAPASLGPDLDRLLARLRGEARIDVRRAQPGETAAVTVQALPHATLRRAMADAACFVVPNVSSWTEYRRRRGSAAVDWRRLSARRRAAVFLPGDVSPQEIRDCLHEELAQAIGPLNDLYRLPDSVFNDDNFQTVLTGFDMLILRAYYAPELANGMARRAVAAALPGLLARIHPAGRAGATPTPSPTPRSWRRAIETALGPDTEEARRRDAAATALRIARRRGWQDTRRAFSLFAVGRAALGEEPERAGRALRDAARIYARGPGMAVQAAHMDMYLAALALAEGRPRTALRRAAAHRDAVTATENAALLASLMMIEAEAQDALDRPERARELRRQSLGWARYGFGDAGAVRARLASLAALDRETGE